MDGGWGGWVVGWWGPSSSRQGRPDGPGKQCNGNERRQGNEPDLAYRLRRRLVGRPGRVGGDSSFAGYDTYLDERMRAVLPACMRHGTRIISNQGWINPTGAAE